MKLLAVLLMVLTLLGRADLLCATPTPTMQMSAAQCGDMDSGEQTPAHDDQAKSLACHACALAQVGGLPLLQPKVWEELRLAGADQSSMEDTALEPPTPPPRAAVSATVQINFTESRS